MCDICITLAVGQIAAQKHTLRISGNRWLSANAAKIHQICSIFFYESGSLFTGRFKLSYSLPRLGEMSSFPVENLEIES
jgi:hypothetical protein